MKRKSQDGKYVSFPRPSLHVKFGYEISRNKNELRTGLVK